jgi:pyruvate dehydrogenase E1 component alpha subunit
MHMADVSRHLWGGYAIVGGHVPVSVGLALANRYRSMPQVVACFLGEGATNTGAFYAGMNLAAVWKLAMIAVVENNHYGMGTATERASSVGDVFTKASAFGIPGERVDGNDVLAVRDAVRRVAERSRAGGGPQLIEAMTYRFRGHSMGDPQRYRTREEVEEAKTHDPIERWRRTLKENDLASEDELRKVEDEVDSEVEDAVRFAESSPPPDPAELCNGVLVPE